MNSATVLILAIAVLLFALAYSVYVKIARKKNAVEESLSGIDVQLKKRHDLIPNVLRIAKKFMQHEKELIKEVTELRTQAVEHASDTKPKDLNQRMELESHLQNKLGQLMVAVENYPDLKSDQPMVQAQKTYNEVEEHISASRRFYNANVRNLNDTILIWPMSMIASMMGVSAYPYFEISPEEQAPVNASDIL